MTFKELAREIVAPPLTVSVIIPTYNRAQYIEAAINSALSQTRVPEEIIVVDDGSTDGTDRILEKYREPVRVIRQANRGRSAARNVGLRAASGYLVVFLDSDDTLVPTSIEHRAQIFETVPDVDVIYGDMYLVDATGAKLGMTKECLPGPRPSGYILADLAVQPFIFIPAMIRRSALGDHVFDETLDQCEDYDFWRQLAATCRFQYVDQPVACYRFHTTNTVLVESTKMLESALEVQRRFFEMKAFEQLSCHQQALAYCYHGAKNAALLRTAEARRYLARAVWTSPRCLTGIILLAFSLLCPRVLSFVISRRREMTRRALSDAIENNGHHRAGHTIVRDAVAAS